MKKQHDGEGAEAVITLQIWTYAGAQKAVPYFRSLTRSLRDGWLAMRQVQEQVRRLESRPGRAERESLIALEDAKRDLARAESNLEEVAQEMLGISAYCVDPQAGLVVIPFLHRQDLAWFVFDLFDDQGIVGWRLYSDPIATRRPLSELNQPEPTAPPQRKAHA